MLFHLTIFSPFNAKITSAAKTLSPFDFHINGSDLILTRNDYFSFVNPDGLVVKTDTGFTANTSLLSDIVIPLSSCPTKVIVNGYQAFGSEPITLTEITPFVLISEYLPVARNLSIQLLPNMNNRTIRLNWTLNTNGGILCPHKILAFSETDDKRCEYETQHNYYEFDLLELNKTYKLGVAVRSLQNNSYNFENFVNYSTYQIPKMICPGPQSLLVVDGLQVKHLPKTMAHVVSWNGLSSQFRKCFSHYMMIQHEKRNGTTYLQMIRSIWHLNNIIYDIHEGSTYEYGVRVIYRNEIYAEVSQLVSISSLSVRSKVTLVHEDQNNTSTDLEYVILKSLTDVEIQNRTFELTIHDRKVVMREV
ncbi:unnamed protein product [Schistosoma rodhaini]|nr:unnamed protein product [Schistosoma rodhaini]